MMGSGEEEDDGGLTPTEDEDDALPEPAPVSKDRRKRNEPAMGEDPLMDLVDDPLQLDWQKRRTPWGKRLLWSLLVLLAAAALACCFSFSASAAWRVACCISESLAAVCSLACLSWVKPLMACAWRESS